MILSKQITSGVPGVPSPGLPPEYPFYLKPIPINTRNVERELTQIITAERPKLARWLYSTWNAEAKAIKYQEIRNAIRDGVIPEEWFAMWSRDYSKFVNTVMAASMTSAAVTAARNVSAGIEAAFTAPGPRTFELLEAATGGWLSKHSAELAVNLTNEQRKALGAILKYHLPTGMHPSEAARYIRPAIGLTKGQAMAVANYRKALLDEGIYGAARVEHMVQNYSARLHRLRANLIARTEMSFAYNRGQLDVVKKYRDAGWLPSGKVVKVWVAASDERMCPYCGGLDGQEIGLDDDWKPARDRPNGVPVTLAAVPAPPAHPGCRCTFATMVRR